MPREKPEDVWLSAAECAAQTGLTVRALHVYERRGLIKPRRTDKGWRVYGAADLAQLNVITALKAIGIPLSQIKALIRADAPSLERVLEIQVAAWHAQKTEAQRGLELAEAALSRLRTDRSLSVQDLCGLVKSFEVRDLRHIIARVIDEQFTPKEQQAIEDWSRDHWPEAAEHSQAFIDARTETRQLMQADAKPSSPDAQRMIERLMKYEHKSAVFEQIRARDTTLFDPDKSAAFTKALVQRMTSESDAGDLIAVERFIDAARRDRLRRWPGWTKFSDRSGEIVAQARKLMRDAIDPSSPAAQKMFARFIALRPRFPLGDPIFYALWAHEKGPGRQDLWKYLGQAESAYIANGGKQKSSRKRRN